MHKGAEKVEPCGGPINALQTTHINTPTLVLVCEVSRQS